MSKLTAVQIRQAKPKDKPYKLPDGQGLYFHVAEFGNMALPFQSGRQGVNLRSGRIPGHEP